MLRKNPVQKRTRQTLDVLFEATAQLLQRDGAKAVNTNAIAERAGFSIGTLYSYFKDKTSLLRALALREFARQEAQFAEALAAHRGLGREAIVRAAVRQGFAPFAGRHRVRRHLLVLFGHDVELQRALHDMVDRMTDRLIEALDLDSEALPPARRYILIRSALGPIRTAVMREHHLIETRDLEDELVQLVLFLAEPRARGAAAC
ncbi:TetR/AcrR family transcriptional regulator [Bradyrhizobium sp. HKCCYLR20261]|uniref:TetR/AcrR family transcriptional regulator n=1 Tax=Bradyrhizobium sp. HKCCYLR20261 TaxID=3420760 RepID=UPI003EBA7BD6